MSAELMTSSALARLERPQQLSDAVVQVLETRIRTRELMPGERLPTERQLADTLGVSRPVVREALARLKADGYVHTRQGAGAVVCERPGHGSFRILAGHDPAKDDLRHLFELRLIVEVAAAALAARRRNAADLSALKAASQRLARALETGTDGPEADEAFHRAIAGATHNPYIQRFVEFLDGWFAETRRPSWTPEGRAAGKATAAQREHLQILDAIEAGEPRAARAAALTHLRSSAKRTGLEPQTPGPAADEAMRHRSRRNSKRVRRGARRHER